MKTAEEIRAITNQAVADINARAKQSIINIVESDVLPEIERAASAGKSETACYMPKGTDIDAVVEYMKSNGYSACCDYFRDFVRVWW